MRTINTRKEIRNVHRERRQYKRVDTPRRFFREAGIRAVILELRKNIDFFQQIKKQGKEFTIPADIIQNESGKTISGFLLYQTEITMEFSKTPKKIWLYINKEGKIGLFSLETGDDGQVYWTNTQWKIKSRNNIVAQPKIPENNGHKYLIIDANFDDTVAMLAKSGLSADKLITR